MTDFNSKFLRSEASHVLVHLKLHGDATLIQLAKARTTTRSLMAELLDSLYHSGRVIRVGKYYRAVEKAVPVTQPEFPSKREVATSELDAVYEALAVEDLKDALTVIQDLKAELEQAQAFRREVAREVGLDALAHPWTVFATVRDQLSHARAAQASQSELICGNTLHGFKPAAK